MCTSDSERSHGGRRHGGGGATAGDARGRRVRRSNVGSYGWLRCPLRLGCRWIGPERSDRRMVSESRAARPNVRLKRAREAGRGIERMQTSLLRARLGHGATPKSALGENVLSRDFCPTVQPPSANSLRAGKLDGKSSPTSRMASLSAGSRTTSNLVRRRQSRPRSPRGGASAGGRRRPRDRNPGLGGVLPKPIALAASPLIGVPRGA